MTFSGTILLTFSCLLFQTAHVQIYHLAETTSIDLRTSNMIHLNGIRIKNSFSPGKPKSPTPTADRFLEHHPGFEQEFARILKSAFEEVISNLSNQNKNETHTSSKVSCKSENIFLSRVFACKIVHKYFCKTIYLLMICSPALLFCFQLQILPTP